MAVATARTESWIDIKPDVHHVLNAFNGQEVFHYMDLFFNNLSNIARKSVHFKNNSKLKNSSMDIWNLGKVLNR